MFWSGFPYLVSKTTLWIRPLASARVRNPTLSSATTATNKRVGLAGVNGRPLATSSAARSKNWIFGIVNARTNPVLALPAPKITGKTLGLVNVKTFHRLMSNANTDTHLCKILVRAAVPQKPTVLLAKTVTN